MERARKIATAAAVLCLQGCTLGRALVHNFPGLNDERAFASRVVARAAAASPLGTLVREPQFMAELRVPDGEGGNLPVDEYLARTSTAAFVVMRDQRVVFERYARGYDATSRLNSFSIAKSVIGTLVGIALAEGRIASLDDRVARYRPELAGSAYGAVTLRGLVTMTSGVDDPPALLPARAQYYYGEDLGALTARTVAAAPPGRRWRYSEADVQVLGLVLEAAVGRTVSGYLAEKLWAPLGMESEALWSLDREGGVEKAFCCLRARARDFARIGRLYLDGGRWNGAQIVPASWAARAAVPGARVGAKDIHRQLWWSRADGESDFYAYGHNGQYLYVNPGARTVIVKFSETKDQDPIPAFRAIARALARPESLAELERLGSARVAKRMDTYAVASRTQLRSSSIERRTP